MTRRPVPPSSASPVRAPAGRRVDVGAWLAGIRFSGFVGIMLGLVVLAAFVLVPTVGTYLDQRAQVAAMRQAVQASEDEVAALQAEQDRWRDPAYIVTQARERLYYGRPGETLYLIVNDLPPEAQPQDPTQVSAGVHETATDWMAQFVRTVTSTGLMQPVVPAPEP